MDKSKRFFYKGKEYRSIEELPEEIRSFFQDTNRSFSDMVQETSSEEAKNFFETKDDNKTVIFSYKEIFFLLIGFLLGIITHYWYIKNID
ncbi:MAG: hypothetical protein H7A25_02745 [Leptospiraceae bacterium]|nr:hypothetical protein [Leptospiraceae bacterium]MCP5498796.1 hypothetical protein [Leptospiraceae bacterium]